VSKKKVRRRNISGKTFVLYGNCDSKAIAAGGAVLCREKGAHARRIGTEIWVNDEWMKSGDTN